VVVRRSTFLGDQRALPVLKPVNRQASALKLAKQLKRYLYLTHRWFGVCMCLLIALWFASGVVIMYVQYPTLTEAERLENLEEIDAGQIRLSAADAMHRVGLGASGVRAIRLSMLKNRPAYVFRDMNNTPVTVFADTGEVLTGLSPEQALDVVRNSGFYVPGTQPVHQGVLDMDQWTISGSLHPSRPLHKVAIDDSANTTVYVSDVSGHIVLDTNRRERIWNWFGTTIHWIYPVQLRQHQALWTDVVIYLSLAGLVSVITGGMIGFMRLRVRKPYRGKDVTPYHGVDKWHHVLGLVSLVFLATFMFSGLLSMSPWGLFASSTSPAEQITRYQGGPIRNLNNFPDLQPDHLNGIREVDWYQIGGQGHLLLSSSVDERYVVVGNTREATPSPLLQQRIEAAVPLLIPTADTTELERLDGFDNYYYSTHNRYRPLPAMRVHFDDGESTWFDLDLNSGNVILRHTDSSRIYRWLYNGLHSLDFIYLLERRPLWDIVVLVLSIIGLVFSMTAVMIGWRRLLQQF